MDNTLVAPSRADEMADDAFTSVFPNGLPSAKPAAGSAIVRSFPLEADHLQALATSYDSGEKLNVVADPRLRMSRRHHRLAQLLANGMEPGRAAVVCGLAGTTVSILQSDPLFGELLEHYSSFVDEEFRTVVEEMAELHMEVVEVLKSRLEEKPETFTAGTLTDLMKALSDRTGNGPTSTTNSRSVSISVSGAELERIKAGARPEPSIPGSDGPSAPRRVGTQPSFANLPAVRNAATLRQTGEWEGEGICVGAEGSRPCDETVPLDQVALPRVD